MWSRPTSCHRLMKSVLNIEFLDKIKNMLHCVKVNVHQDLTI